MAQFGNQPSNSKGAHSKSGSGTSSASLTPSIGDTVPALDLSASSFGPRAENKEGNEGRKKERVPGDVEESARRLAEAEQKLAELKNTPPPSRESFKPGLGGWLDHKAALSDRRSKIDGWGQMRFASRIILQLDQMLADMEKESRSSKDEKNNENKATGTVEQSNLQVAILGRNEVAKRDNTDVRIARVDSVDAKQNGAQR